MPNVISKTQREKIEQAAINGTLLDLTFAKNTHIHRHQNISDKDALERVLNEVPTNSVFNKNADVNYFIEEAILFSANDIANWQKTASDYEIKTFRTRLREDEGYDTVGYNIIHDSKTNLIKEYNTDSIRIVLQNQPNMPLGFSILTAYPDTDTPNIKQTNKDLSKTIKDTKQYENADPVGKAYMLYRTYPKNTASIAYKKGYVPEDSVIYMHIQTENPNTKHIIKIKEHSTTIKTVKTDESNNIIPTKYTQMRDKLYPLNTFTNLEASLAQKQIFNEFKNDFPDEAKAIKFMKNIITDNIPSERLMQLREHRAAKTQKFMPTQPSQPETQNTPKF